MKYFNALIWYYMHLIIGGSFHLPRTKKGCNPPQKSNVNSATFFRKSSINGLFIAISAYYRGIQESILISNNYTLSGMNKTTGSLLKGIRIPMCFVTFSSVTGHGKTWMSVLLSDIICLPLIKETKRELSYCYSISVTHFKGCLRFTFPPS